MGRAATSPQRHVEHFLSTVEDYENLEQTMPLPRSISVFGQQDDASRWIVILHAVLLRKYFAPGSGERLRLDEVVRSIQACAIESAIDIDWQAIVENVRLVESVSLHIIGGVERSDEDIHYDELYGRYLHGDFDKWERTNDSYRGWQDPGVLTATIGRADRLMKVAALVRGLKADGLLKLT